MITSIMESLGLLACRGSRVLVRPRSSWTTAHSAALLGLRAGRRAASDGGALKFNKPPSAQELPRPAGIASMFRLPVYTSSKGKKEFSKTKINDRFDKDFLNDTSSKGRINDRFS